MTHHGVDVSGRFAMRLKYIKNISMTHLFLVFCFLFQSVTSQLQPLGPGFYSIIGSRVLRPNSEYSVSISTHSTVEATNVVVEIHGKQDSGGPFKASQFVSVEPSTTRLVKLEISDIGLGQYNLTVQGNGGLNFRNTTALEYMHKSYTVFVQTDKAIYKPGHKVLFRALVLSPSLKPVNTRSLDIYITDGKGNRVKQWKRQPTREGIFSSEFQLSEHPVLGDWNITVVVLDQEYHKVFKVAEYVLPKFQVNINTPQHITFKQSTVVLNINAKYTYGGPVKGEATVTVNPNIHLDVQPFLDNPVWKVVPIDGKATVEFDIAKELKLKEDYERLVQFDVTVEEKLSGRRQNTSTQIVLHRNKYKMEIMKTAEYFKPGLKYITYVKIAHYDGTPVTDNTNAVKIRQYDSYNDDEFIESKHKLGKDGLIMLELYPQNVTTIRIEAEYLDLKEWFPPISASVSPSNTFLQVTLKTEKPAVNQEIEIAVNATEPFRSLSYQIFGRGSILGAQTVTVPYGQTTATIRFLATYLMAPTAHFVAHFIKESGEVVADVLDLDLDGVLQNEVSASFGKDETQTGVMEELKLQAKPFSYIGVLGVDQSVLLLKSGNDISKESVIEELRSYDSLDDSQYPSFTRDARIERSNNWWPGSFTAHEAFTKSGAVILTNGHVHEHYPWVYYRSNFDEVDNDMSVAENLANLDSDLTKTLTGDNKVRRNFPETWLWDMLESGYDGKASLKTTVPDTITSWVITAFSVDNTFGLGLMDSPTKLRVFRPFFIRLDLPYSVRRGEIVAIPALVFNYLNRDLSVDVTLENVGQFEFADYSNDIVEPPKLDLYRKKKTNVKSNAGAAVTFLIKPTTIGQIVIKVSATSSLAGDTVQMNLLVKPEGQTIYRNKAMFIDLRKKSSVSANVSLGIPANFVSDSENIEISAVGDILGPSIPNLANLIKMPYGCGEQNMLNFVPNIVVLDYLKNSQQLTADIENRLIRYLEIGYQQELTYRRNDGSFSAFGAIDPSGSTWLTAFVVKSFKQASPYITIEENVITQALDWLVLHQAPNGSFPEVGKVSHSAMQGGSAKGVALTAYVLITFLESQGTSVAYRNAIGKALNYLASNMGGIDDSYSLAICSYAFQLAFHPEREAAFNLLEAQAQTDGDMKFWRRKVVNEKNPFNSAPNSIDIEMTSYALLSYTQRMLYEDAIPILSWLITQQNSGGGFASTQDTVVGLYALSKLAEKISTSNRDIQISVTSDSYSTNIKVNQDNAMITQKLVMPKETRNAMISAQGTGFAIVQIGYSYNVNVTGEWPLFLIDPQVDKSSTKNHLRLSVCASFVGGNDSNMAVMEVGLPSGYTIDEDALPSLMVAPHNVKRVETKDGNTGVVLYFDKMSRQEFCPTVSAFRTHRVANQLPAPVLAYDYYDQTRKGRVFYSAQTATICDICEGTDCDKVCSSGKIGSQSGNKNENSAGLVHKSWSLSFVGIFVLWIVRV